MHSSAFTDAVGPAGASTRTRLSAAAVLPVGPMRYVSLAGCRRWGWRAVAVLRLGIMVLIIGIMVIIVGIMVRIIGIMVLITGIMVLIIGITVLIIGMTVPIIARAALRQSTHS